MCGFVGFYDPDKGTFDRNNVLEKMSRSIAHRGPDSDGKYDDGVCALGFRRLSIIDLEGGSQPITSEDGRYTIVFNGEIYNYRDIRKELERYNVTFRTNSDTETILVAYTVFGEDVVTKLRGMFAFVIYDGEKKTLFGARDYFGIKPFYYTFIDGAFVFGSEIKSFLLYPGFRKEVNPDALKLYMTFQYSPLPETMFRGVYKLPQGTAFSYDGRELKKKTYFSADYAPVKRGDEETADLIDKTVRESVKYHKIADVEVGSFLSGGVDSSYIVAAAMPEKTYSVGFDVKGFDECSLAEELSGRLGIKNRTKRITPDEFFDALPSVQYHSDEPHANLSAVPLFFLSKMAAEDVKVVLSGEGADEMFGGYASYVESAWLKCYKKLPLGIRKKLKDAFADSGNKHLKRFFNDGGTELAEKYIGQAFIMTTSEADRLLSEKYRTAITYGDVTRPIYDEVKDCDEITKKMYLDMRLWLPDDILLKADKMTMAHSLELRVPYLDKEVFALSRTLTPSQLTKGRETKRVFRIAANRSLPDDWANRIKVGFLVPFRHWIKDEKYGSRVREMFNRDFAAEFFDVGAINSLLDDHMSGKKNNTRTIYTVYSFLLWYEQYFVLR